MSKKSISSTEVEQILRENGITLTYQGAIYPHHMMHMKTPGLYHIMSSDSRYSLFDGVNWYLLPDDIMKEIERRMED